MKNIAAEFIGTALLVFCAVGVATASFGFGLTGSSKSAGVVATAVAFGLTLLILAYALGPVSGCHINPAVTLGFVITGRLRIREALDYWAAQVAGGIGGAALLLVTVSSATGYSRDHVGLGADGFGRQSMLGINAGGALIAELILTAIFVFVVLSVTRNDAAPAVAGVVIGLALTTVHLVGIPLTGTSVNPARSIGPALLLGGSALSQLWVFIVGPLVGAALGGLTHRYFYPSVRGAARVDVATAAAPRVDG